jgi:hypothetical protein
MVSVDLFEGLLGDEELEDEDLIDEEVLPSGAPPTAAADPFASGAAGLSTLLVVVAGSPAGHLSWRRL